MTADDFKAHQGGCDCEHVRYTIVAAPFIVHCCHCKLCQRQTGSAFVINALFEAASVELIHGEIAEITSETPTGQGQTIARCPKCKVAIWSNYFMGGIKKGIRFIRVGTLDDPNRHPPDVHIFTTTKQRWVEFPSGAHVEDIFYDYETTWSPENLKRREELLARIAT